MTAEAGSGMMVSTDPPVRPGPRPRRMWPIASPWIWSTGPRHRHLPETKIKGTDRPAARSSRPPGGPRTIFWVVR